MKRSELQKRHFPLKDTTLTSLEPELNEYRLNDGDNLHFVVGKKGNKRWELRYKSPTTQKWTWLGLGTYPEVGGKFARSKAAEARKLLSEGIDPKLHKAEQKKALLNSKTFTFKSLADEYFSSKNISSNSFKRHMTTLENHVYPVFAKRDYRQITKKEWFDLIKKIQKKPNSKTGGTLVNEGDRVRVLCKDIYSLAEITDRIEHNPLASIGKFVEKSKRQSMSHVEKAELPDLLKAITSYGGMISIALQLIAMLACRPSELIEATWSEFDLDNALWTIHEERMKKRREHVIPLPTQAVDLLNELREFCDLDKSDYLFQNRDDKRRHTPRQSLSQALERMGYKGKQTPHGFRHIFSTSLREKGFQREHVEMSLAHIVQGAEGSYNKAVYLTQRREMMQHWADYLESLISTDGKL